jgi:hypothetical protein
MSEGSTLLGFRRFSSRREPLDRSFLCARLRHAQSYDRIAGYFSSSLVEVAGEELESVSGKVRMICNSDLDTLVGVSIRVHMGPVVTTAFVSIGTLATLLCIPSGDDLARLLESASLRHHECRAENKRIKARHGELSTELDELRRERTDLISSALFEHEQLLKRNWRDLRGVAWEEFLFEAFEALGGHVETTPTTGDQGIDLIVTLRGRRIAIQAKGFQDVVGNGAVQEAVAGRFHYRCHACAVITNARFTPAARELAESMGCMLIGEDQIPAFVRGEVSALTLPVTEPA